MSRLQKWALRLDDSRRAPLLLFWLSTLETVALPIAFELLLGPHMLRHPRGAWRAATWAVAGTLFGALITYVIGMLTYDTLGMWLVTSFEYQEQMNVTWTLFRRYGFWAIVLIGITPIPYQIALLMAGAAHYSIPLLLLAGLMARGTRYYLLAWLVRKYGESALQLWRRRRALAALVAMFATVAVISATAWLGQEVQEEAEEVKLEGSG
jgi:membrane protein YqaA with SNARE-associated domain